MVILLNHMFLGEASKVLSDRGLLTDHSSISWHRPLRIRCTGCRGFKVTIEILSERSTSSIIVLHIISYNIIMSTWYNDNILYHIISYYIILYHIISYYIILYYMIYIYIYIQYITW